MRKVISVNYIYDLWTKLYLWTSSSSWKSWEWVKLDPIFTMMDIYINSNLNPLTKFTSSSRSTEFKDILPWSIFLKIKKTIPVSMRKVKGYTMKWGIRFEFGKKSLETETTTWSEFPNGWKAIVKQVIAPEKRKKSKRPGLWESQSAIQVGKIIIWVKSFEIEKLKEFTRSFSCQPLWCSLSIQRQTH